MSVQSDKFRTKKLDQSPYLFHFTSGTVEEAKANLNSILKEKKLRARSKDYICFTASPITQVGSFFDTKVIRTGQPMYQPYGIGFSRDILIKQYGAKNVAYGDATDEALMAHIGMGWRFLKLDVDVYDYEYLREWRTHGNVLDFSGFPKDHIIVIAPTDDSLLDFVTREYCVLSWDIDEQTGQKFDDYVEQWDRAWKGVSLEQIKNQNLLNDYQVSGSTADQRIGDDMFYEVTEQMMRKTKEINEMIAKSWEEFMNGTK